MRKLQRVLAVIGASAAITAGMATAAQAAGTADAPTKSERTGATAEYNGKIIDLSQGWQGATVCVEQVAGDVDFRCYDEVSTYRSAEALPQAEPEFGVFAKSDCPSNNLCLWANKNYRAAMVRFVRRGTHHLDDVDFRDKATSVYNRRTSNSDLIDSRSFPVQDRVFTIKNGGSIADLGLIHYPGGGHWNNKIDIVRLN
ncbi:Peptidase inhibitor family I36 [Amycolatopsis arida]|uniref:Peptidase inhibitor family I36 n=1 Tax=Amycolatopsis arida TaxID=587909 RepID=A0A1I5V485_9PSEU|nr:peptidase inhibitor family I36 protein [Amycolatopsis arida]TDX91145.1 peptidase inhibitor family I36 [Amycolatopsis arida]SFQ02329.1 Peptidase inhibitor family I36 [Amycolatopsis arida]